MKRYIFAILYGSMLLNLSGCKEQEKTETCRCKEQEQMGRMYIDQSSPEDHCCQEHAFKRRVVHREASLSVPDGRRSYALWAVLSVLPVLYSFSRLKAKGAVPIGPPHRKVTK